MVKSGTITITVTTSGPVPGSITAAASSTTPTTGQSITVSGRYLSTVGGGIAGATLYLFVNGVVQQMTTVTGPDGSYAFTFSFAAAGTYTVDVSDNVGNT